MGVKFRFLLFAFGVLTLLFVTYFHFSDVLISNESDESPEQQASTTPADKAQILVLGLDGTPTILVTKILEQILKSRPNSRSVSKEGPFPHIQVENKKEREMERRVQQINQNIYNTIYQHSFPTVESNSSFFPRIVSTPPALAQSSTPWFASKFSTSSGFRLDLAHLTEKEKKDVNRNLSSVVGLLDRARPWVLQDSKMSLLLPLWRKHLPNLVCIFVYSPPTSLVKTSLSLYPGLSATDLLSLWQNSTISSLNGCYDRPAILISHTDLVSKPLEMVQKVYERLESFQLTSLSLPNQETVLSLCSEYALPLLPNNDRDLHALSSIQQRIVDFFEYQFEPLVNSGALFPHNVLFYELNSQTKREAYATLLTYSDEPYVAGALTLMQSINAFDRTRTKLVLVLDGMPDHLANLFRKINVTVIFVEEVEEFYFDNSEFCLTSRNDMASQNKMKRWGKMFTKLRVWQLTQFSRIIYLDTDTIAFPSLPALFYTTEVMVAEGGKQHLGFNAGFMVLEPSNFTFNHMMETLRWQTRTKAYPKMFNNQLDCTEQAFLNDYFPLFKHVSIGRPDDLSSGPNKHMAPLAHWITLSCYKPWSVLPCKVAKNCNQFLYSYWWQNFELLDTSILATDQPTVSFWQEFKKRNNLLNTCPK